MQVQSHCATGGGWEILHPRCIMKGEWKQKRERNICRPGCPMEGSGICDPCGDRCTRNDQAGMAKVHFLTARDVFNLLATAQREVLVCSLRIIKNIDMFDCCASSTPQYVCMYV